MYNQEKILMLTINSRLKIEVQNLQHSKCATMSQTSRVWNPLMFAKFQELVDNRSDPDISR